MFFIIFFIMIFRFFSSFLKGLERTDRGRFDIFASLRAGIFSDFFPNLVRFILKVNLADISCYMVKLYLFIFRVFQSTL